MSDRAPWEKAAADFASPAVVVVAGVVGSPRLSQWGGGSPDDPPTSLTLSYDESDVSVTTYWDAEWWDGDMPVWNDIWEFVESGAGWRFASPLDIEGRKVIDETKTPAEDGHYLVIRTFEPDPPEVHEKERARVRQMVSETVHREVDIPLDDLPVRAVVVGGPDAWDAAVERYVNDRHLVASLHGTDTPIEPLKLAVIDDFSGSAFLGAEDNMDSGAEGGIEPGAGSRFLQSST
jgi:hypothetical protein